MSNKTMLNRAKDWLTRLGKLKSQQTTPEDMNFVQEHIDIMTYLVDCAEEVESNVASEDIVRDDIPTRREMSE